MCLCVYVCVCASKECKQQQHFVLRPKRLCILVLPVLFVGSQICSYLHRWQRRHTTRSIPIQTHTHFKVSASVSALATHLNYSIRLLFRYFRLFHTHALSLSFSIFSYFHINRTNFFNIENMKLKKSQKIDGRGREGDMQNTTFTFNL